MHYILAKNSAPNQKNANSLNFFASLDTQDILKDGIIVD